MTEKPTTCALCSAPLTGDARETHLDQGVPYSLYECSLCRGQFWWPLQNPGAGWYEHDERYGDRNRDPILTPNKKHRDVVAYFAHKTGRVLDVGCGTGNFLVHAEAKGWEGWGIDFDADAIAAGKAALGLTHLEACDLETFARNHPDLRFDLVSFFDVLEHLDDHAAFMSAVRDVLTPGGSIALSVPYRHGWRWLLPHDLPPRHLTRWDEESLRRFLAQEGFEISVTKRLPASFYYLVLKFRFRYGKWASFGLVRRAKAQDAKSAAPSTGTRKSAPSRTVSMVERLAKAKDMILFGIPAGIVWLALLFTRARYTDIYLVAKTEHPV